MTTSKETTPDGIAQHVPGAKLDAGKVRAGLVIGGFSMALWEVCRIGTFGCEKYSPGGWLHVQNGEARYDDALMRHILKDKREPFDPDTELSHLAHAAWNALAKLELELRRRAEYGDFTPYQDAPRYKKESA